MLGCAAPDVLLDVFWRRLNEGGDVMHDLAIAGTRLGHLHISVFREFGIVLEISILVRPAGFERKLLRHCQNMIRFADRPAFDELRLRREVLRIPLKRALVDPGDYRFDLLLRQTAVIGPPAGMRIGVPGRHLAIQDFFANRFGPGTDVFVSQSRERRGFARAMTLGAILEEERSDVFVECQVSCGLDWR
jgi:hypothetical protein